MTRNPTHHIGLGLLICALCTGAGALARDFVGPGMPPPRAEPAGGRPFGGGFDARERIPVGRPGGDYAPMGYDRPRPGRGSVDGRREPGPLDGSYPAPRYVPPRYAAPPPRRPFQAMPGWRAAAEPAPRLNEGGVAPLGRVIENLQRRSPGRQLDAEAGYLGDRAVYRVLWLTAHGRRMDYVVDAETGAIISER